ncbi:hypothetical protein DFH28DRAFT_906325 [Melampsora americana]|nr:hypothetical protein DFH28DRAFT_906325 [Melampsora americana]
MRDKSIVHPVQTFYPGRVTDVVEVCKILHQKGITPKEFMNCSFAADNGELRYRRRIWGTDEGWPSSVEVMLSMRQAVCEQKGGDQLWNDFILDEAKRIVTSQEPPQGTAPHGSYYSSGDITSDFFLEENTTTREIALQSSIPFLYDLISAKILSSIVKDDKEELELITPNPTANTQPSDSNEGMSPCDDDGELLEGITETKPKTHRDLKILQSTAVPTMICSMVAFVCNRRSNGMQIHNAMTFLACGASERLNEFLHFHGLSAS